MTFTATYESSGLADDFFNWLAVDVGGEIYYCELVVFETTFSVFEFCETLAEFFKACDYFFVSDVFSSNKKTILPLNSKYEDIWEQMAQRTNQQE